MNTKIVNFIGTNDNKHGNGARNGDEESSQPMLRFVDNGQIDSVNISNIFIHLKLTMEIEKN